ncbi:hypothetical protein ZYGR_0AS06060 [Zygosaccharomyces rouxii]|uniref:Uncharacterized protein n=1 Tax=Zygosaccharomyces rouxii TaxID=4956 RepID=A0A1Q3AI18_ZYGRO|nr:hypothetical protein ZYGR_0AS06060 [Zygosaccharomyces rouxii]
MLVSRFYGPLTRHSFCNSIKRTSRLYSSSKDQADKNPGSFTLEENLDGDQPPRTRGKKLKPSKTNFLVLDPSQTGLLKRRSTPSYFRSNHGKKLSILEGVELGLDSNSRGPRRSRHSTKILQEIEAQRKKLLVFKSSVSKEQAVRSINYQKPSTTNMSKRRYDQLKHLLDSAYTLPQLKAYTKKYYGIAHSKTTKDILIETIMMNYWNCEPNDFMDESEDLILERIINVDIRDMYLLLLTNNGKILNNFSRIGATLAVALDENIMIVRGTSPIIKYVEVSLSNILANVNTMTMNLRQFVSDHSVRDQIMSDMKLNELISLIQRESAVFFELMGSEPGDGVYRISAFGHKRVSKAQNLLLWGAQYHPQLSEEVEQLGTNDQDVNSFEKFPFTDVECLDWINRNKEWYRLQKPISKKRSPHITTADHKNNILSDEKLDKWYDFLMDQKKEAQIMPLKLDESPKKMFSMTLGQLLTTINGEATLFEPKIPQVMTKLLELPLYDSLSSKDELYTMDQHDYYVQLNFIPNLSDVPHTNENAPPIELWFELDEFDVAITNSVRCITQLQQRSLFVQTPQQPRDLKINVDTVAELTETYEEGLENWLSRQPGIKKFLQDSRLTFQSRKNLVIPESMDVNLHHVDGERSRVQYDYVNAVYHRILRLKYMDKYLVQFSDIKGGSSGANHTQVDFIGGELLSRDDFKQFVKDVSQFV